MAAPQLFKFRLTPHTRLILSKGDLTRYSGDAIVNAANERMLGGGGVDGAIHRAAGPRLLEECRKVPQVEPGVRCPTGEARITPGCDLPARFVIHTVGPVYDNDAVSEPLLASAYRSSLRLANERGLKTVAFPAISCGVFGYPYSKAAKVALRISKEEAGGLAEVQFVLFQDQLLDVWREEAEANFDPIVEEEGGEGEHRRKLESPPPQETEAKEGQQGEQESPAPPGMEADGGQQRQQEPPAPQETKKRQRESPAALEKKERQAEQESPAAPGAAAKEGQQREEL